MPSQEIIKMTLTVASRDAGIDQRKSLGAVQFQQHGISSPAGPTFKTANIRGSGHYTVRSLWREKTKKTHVLQAV